MKKFANRIELAFWDMAIPLLTESDFVKVSVRGVHNIYKSANSWLLPVLFLWAALSLLAIFAISSAGIINW